LVKIEYDYGSGFNVFNTVEVIGTSYIDNLFYFNAGMELHLFILRNLSLFTKGIIHLQLINSQDYYYKSPRYQLSLGVNYKFGNDW